MDQSIINFKVYEDSVESVSYTHLDVYKRQKESWAKVSRRQHLEKGLYDGHGGRQ